MNVINWTVKHDYCIGCGVCAGICPSNNLKMDWSNQGELIPHPIESCNENCSICLEICPFFNHEQNQDSVADSLFSKTLNMEYNEFTGFYHSCYEGYLKDENERLKCASGGAATWVLKSLLTEKIIDGIIAVVKSKNPDRMFEFKILSSSDEVESSAGSVYYPVEISQVLKIILQEKNKKTYAVIVLPCVAYALRLAMEKIPKLKRKIKIIASLTCGQLQNRFCTEILAIESGVCLKDLAFFDYRRCDKERLASDFLQVPIDFNGNEGKPLNYHGLPYHLWKYHYFKQNACNYCDDIFGEIADVTFMDAWLPDYMKDYRGRSLIIIRGQEIISLFENLNENHFKLKSINVQNIIKSQEGVIKKKRIILAGKLYQTKNEGRWYPHKRVKPNIKHYHQYHDYIQLTEVVQNKSKNIWPLYRNNLTNNEFWNKMKNCEKKINQHKFHEKFSILKTILKKFFNRI